MKWNFQRLLRKNKVEFPGVLVFGLGIFKKSNTILWNFPGWRFVLSGISRSKVKKTKDSRKGFQKSISSTPHPPVWIFSEIAQ